MIPRFELTVVNESNRSKMITLPEDPDRPEGVHIIWSEADLPQKIRERGFSGYLWYVSAPELLPLSYVTRDEKVGHFMRQIRNEAGERVPNVWQWEPLQIDGDHFIRFALPPGQKLFLAFREEEDFPI